MGGWPQISKNVGKMWGVRKKRKSGKKGVKMRKNTIFRVGGPKFGPLRDCPQILDPCQPMNNNRIFMHDFMQISRLKLTGFDKNS